MRDPGTCSTNLIRPKADRLLNKAFLGALVGGIDRRQRVEEIETGIDLLGQLHFEREVVDFLQAGDFLGLALLDLGRAGDHADVTRAGKGLGAVHDAVIGPDQVVGRHLAAVVEIDVVTELEGIDKPSARDDGLLGKFRNRLALGGVPRIERPMQTLGEDLVLGARCGVNVQAGETRAVGRRHPDGSALARCLGLRRGRECQPQASHDRNLLQHFVFSNRAEVSRQRVDHPQHALRKLLVSEAKKPTSGCCRDGALTGTELTTAACRPQIYACKRLRLNRFQLFGGAGNTARRMVTAPGLDGRLRGYLLAFIRLNFTLRPSACLVAM